MVLHLHLVELIKGEFGDALDQDREFATEKVCLGLEIDLFLNWGSRENIISDANVVEEDALELLRLGWRSKDLVLLEGLQIVHVKVTDN